MCKFNIVTVRKLKDSNVFEPAGCCSVFLILLGDISGKQCVFRSAQGAPKARGVGRITASDIVYNQCRRILIRMFTDKLIGIFFKVGQAFEKIAVFFNRH